MVYALCLAGGMGTRMQNTGLPKQFLNINNKPIIIYTLEKLTQNKNIDKVITVCNKDFCDYLNDLLKEYNLDKKVYITKGGNTRVDSVINGINYIKDQWGISDTDIFLAHDSVRPFVSNEILDNNIENAKKYKSATTVYNLLETIVETNNDGEIFKCYPRINFYSGQSPQTFNINFFVNSYKNIPNEILEKFTDLSEIIVYNNLKVKTVLGDRNNIKITTPIDLIIAEDLIKKFKNL